MVRQSTVLERHGNIRANGVLTPVIPAPQLSPRLPHNASPVDMAGVAVPGDRPYLNFLMLAEKYCVWSTQPRNGGGVALRLYCPQRAHVGRASDPAACGHRGPAYSGGAAFYKRLCLAPRDGLEPPTQ